MKSFFWLSLFYRWELNQGHAAKKWKTQDLNPSCWIPKPMLLTITLKITMIASGHHKDILTLSLKCLKPVSVFTLSSIGAEHKKLLVLKKSFQSCCSHSSFATSSKIKVTVLNLWPYNHFQFMTTNYNAQNTEIWLYGQSF